jgi:divalent metal cation (Fe/Co/Zn/Cd) transporter
MRIESLDTRRVTEPHMLAIVLLRVTIGWNVAEGVIAISSGIAAGSVALVGFGLDSFIEVTAAAILLWRMGLPADDAPAEARETFAHRVVGITFLVLAAYILLQALYVFASDGHPESSTIGIWLAGVSLVVMPVVGLAKRWNAKRLGSRALIAESTETLVCSYLSLTLFVGLAANALYGWWWADVLAALAMVPWIVKEGLEGIRAEGCDAE